MASSNKRMSYTACFKLRVIETSEQFGNRSAGREHNVSEKLVWDRRKKKSELKALPRTRRSQRIGAKLAARVTRDRSDRTDVHPRVYAWHMSGRTLDRSSSLSRNAKRMRLIFQHLFLSIFGCPCLGVQLITQYDLYIGKYGILYV